MVFFEQEPEETEEVEDFFNGIFTNPSEYCTTNPNVVIIEIDNVQYIGHKHKQNHKVLDDLQSSQEDIFHN